MEWLFVYALGYSIVTVLNDDDNTLGAKIVEIFDEEIEFEKNTFEDIKSCISFIVPFIMCPLIMKIGMDFGNYIMENCITL